MDRDTIKRFLFTNLTKKLPSSAKDGQYAHLSDKLGDILTGLNKRELHAIYMAMKAIKR